MMLLLVSLLASQAAALPATVTPAEQVVQRQLEAYNAHDIDAFAATYAEDVELYAHPGRLMAKGKAALVAQYGPMFAQAKPVARIVNRTVLGDQVADVEAITLGGREYCCALAIYKVTDGKIARVDFVATADFMADARPPE